MNILLTNDDGIEAPGLWAAARALAPLGEVLVIAPASNRSGYGAAILAPRELSFTPYAHVPAELRGVRAFALPAPPAVCAQVGLSGVLSDQTIDLVVSGVNDALNIGRDLIYSGTVGATLTAHLLGVPAIAASLDWSSTRMRWETVEWAIRELVRSLDLSACPTPLINLNVPNLPVAEITGFITTRLGDDCCLGRSEIAVKSDGILGFSYTQVHASPDAEEGTDGWAVAHGYVSVTPLQLFPDVLFVAPWHEPALRQPLVRG